MSISSVAVFGGTGTLGRTLVHALHAASFRVTVLSRTPSRPSFLPESVRIAALPSLADHAALVAVLAGHDALVSAAGTASLPLQPALIAAAVDAGVRLFVPSEFGGASGHSRGGEVPAFAAKRAVQDVLRKEAERGRMGYVLVNNGLFLDWALENGFVVDVLGKETTRVWDGGEGGFSATLLRDVGRVVVGVLREPEKWRNRTVRVNSAVVTQRQLLQAARKAMGGEGGFEVEDVKGEEVERDAKRMLETGEGDRGAAVRAMLLRALFSPEFGGGVYPQDDTRELGIEVLDAAGVEAVVAEAVRVRRGL